MPHQQQYKAQFGKIFTKAYDQIITQIHHQIRLYNQIYHPFGAIRFRNHQRYHNDF